LQRWLEEAHRCYAGQPTTELGQELAEALFQFPIPRACFEQIVEGCRMDLTPRRYATFADLRVYCEKVASAVGLASIEIFEYRHPARASTRSSSGRPAAHEHPARHRRGWRAGRLYLPLEDLARFGVGSPSWSTANAPASRGAALLRFEAERAREHYARAEALLPAEDRRAMASAELMAGVYRTLLDELVRRSFPPGPRLRLSTPRKLWVAARTLARVYARR
jgi:phytoene synthase